MASIKDIRVWKNSSKTETRIYVHTDDGREGVMYRTESRWHKVGDREGKLTDAEWTEAKRISNEAYQVAHGYDKTGWATVYENEMWNYDDQKRAALLAAETAKIESQRAANKNKRVETCARCGEQIEAGAGWGEYISEKNTDEEDLDFIYGGRTGWFYYHNDSSLCERNRASAKEAKQQAKDAAQAERDAWHKKEDDATHGMVEVHRFDYTSFREVAERKQQWSRDEIKVGEINGVRCAVLYHYFGGHDFTETTRFYCADPAHAGLSASVDDGSPQASWQKFFGS